MLKTQDRCIRFAWECSGSAGSARTRFDSATPTASLSREWSPALAQAAQSRCLLYIQFSTFSKVPKISATNLIGKRLIDVKSTLKCKELHSQHTAQQCAKTISFSVSVPVLSENTKFTCPNLQHDQCSGLARCSTFQRPDPSLRPGLPFLQQQAVESWKIATISYVMRNHHKLWAS